MIISNNTNSYFIRLSSESCDSSRLHIGEDEEEEAGEEGEANAKLSEELGLWWRGFPSCLDEAEKEEKKAEARCPPERRLKRPERRRAGRRTGDE